MSKDCVLGRDRIIIKLCQWIGDDEEHPSCGRDVFAEGKSYCEEHHWMVYEKGTALRKRHKDIRLAELLRSVASELNDAAELEDDDHGVEELRF